MGVESGVGYIDDLVVTNPESTDVVAEGDDHIRLTKQAVTGSFTSLGREAVTKTAAEINDLATVTGTETLTNKTLTAPTLTTPVVSGDLTLGATDDIFKGTALYEPAWKGEITLAGTAFLYSNFTGWSVSRPSTGVYSITGASGDTFFSSVIIPSVKVAGYNANITAQSNGAFTISVTDATGAPANAITTFMIVV